MAIVDYSYYMTVYGGSQDASSFNSLSEKAEREVEQACLGRIKSIGFDNLTPYQKDCVQRAICYEIDYLSAYGEIIDSPVSSMSIGSTSMSFGGAENGKLSRISSDAGHLLEGSGLTCRILR